jgi:hypothetical protein
MMLNQLSTDRLNAIAEAARQLRSTQGDLVEQARVSRDTTGGETRPGSAIDSGLDDPNATGPDGPLARLQHEVDALNADQRRELLAVMFIGRGEFAAGEWDRALAQAERVPPAGLTRQATDELQLHDYLEKGLYKIGKVG